MPPSQSYWYTWTLGDEHLVHCEQGQGVNTLVDSVSESPEEFLHKTSYNDYMFVLREM